MNWMFILILIAVYSLEPCLWIMSMKVVNGSKRTLYYELAGVVGYLVLSLGKQYATFCGLHNHVRGSLLVVFWFYIIAAAMFLFQNNWRRKLLSLGIFLLLNLWSELLSIIIYIVFFHCTTDQIASLGSVNIMCTIQEKLLLAILCRSVFFSKNPSKEIIFGNIGNLPFVTAGTVCEIALFMEFPFSKKFLENPLLLGGFLILQSYITLLTGYIIFIAGKQYQEMEKLEQEVKRYERHIELGERCQQLRHDISLYKHMIYYFMEKGQYTELKRYIGDIAQDLEGISAEFELDDITVSNTLNLLVTQIRKAHIRFEHMIMVSDFILTSYDMSRILWNVLKNAIDAVGELKVEDRKIFLELRPVIGGYHINCMNSYKQDGYLIKALYSTTKKDKNSHGKGLAIVKKIVEENGGIMKFSLHPMLFELDCYIPEEGR